ncbi:MAG: hypothetical protein ABI416_11845 [Ginsengibacter sp.]
MNYRIAMERSQIAPAPPPELVLVKSVPAFLTPMPGCASHTKQPAKKISTTEKNCCFCIKKLMIEPKEQSPGYFPHDQIILYLNFTRV